MPTSTSRASYPDCEKFLTAALDDEQGARLPFLTKGMAHQFMVRLNTFRTICRKDNAKIHTDVDHPMHGRSEYDPLEIAVRGPDAEGEFWVYARKRDFAIESEIEPLSTLGEQDAQT